MIDKLKNYINVKLQDTVVGEAKSAVKYLLGKNKKLLAVEMVLTYLVTVLLTGAGIIAVKNLGGAGYRFSLVNMVAAWLKYYGVVISIPVFIFVELIVLKCIKLFQNYYHRDEERNYDISEEGTYGTSRFMTEEDIKETFVLQPINEIKAPIFGKDPYNTKLIVGQKHPMMKLNRNVLMIAGPSAGKSATFVIPLILQIMRAGESAIISDPKSELFKYTSELGKMLGYEVRILNLNSMFLENSDPCNYLLYVGDDVDKAQVVSNAIIKTTTDGDALLDFWTEGALNLLQAVILRINVGNDFTSEEKNLPMVFTYLTQHTMEELEADFETLNRNHPATAPFNIFRDGEEKVKRQVLQGLRIKLKLFNSPKLKKILSKTEGSMDIINPGRKKCLYFIGSNDQDSSLSSLVSLYFTLTIQELVRYADMRMDGELPITVHLVLDEYPAMAIPDFERTLSTVRSRNIVCYVICQDINQLKKKHPDEAFKTVMNDCDYFLMLKTNDPDTMQWWEDMCGSLTANVKNKRYYRSKMNMANIHNVEQITEGQGERKVLMKDDARKIKDDEILVLVSQRNVAKLKTFFWKTDHPYGKYVMAHKDSMFVLPAQHYPFWKLIEDGVADNNFDYDHEPSFVMELPPDENLVIDKDYDPDAMMKIKEKKKQGGTRTAVKEGKKAAESVRSFAGKIKGKAEVMKPPFLNRSAKDPEVQEEKDESSVHKVNMIKVKEQKEEEQESTRRAAEPAPRPVPPKKKKEEKAYLPDPLEKKKSAGDTKAEGKVIEDLFADLFSDIQRDLKEEKKPVKEEKPKQETQKQKAGADDGFFSTDDDFFKDFGSLDDEF